MRSLTAALLVVGGLAVAAADPQKIAFARVFPNAGQIGLFIAAADGTGEHPLLPGNGDVDYDPVWTPDGSSIVFTSDRRGSADLFRVKPDGSGLEPLTDDPSYDDQAAFSPDGKQIVFVSSRVGGVAHLWIMDLQTRRATPVTSGEGSDFRPAWSPNGRWIAFSSGRGGGLPFAHGRWEHLQFVDLYIVHPDGTGLKRISEHGNFCGSPKWRGNSRQLIAYCMTAEQTLANRRPSPAPGNDTRLVSFDVDTGAPTGIDAGAGVKFNPSPLQSRIAFVRKDKEGSGPGIYYVDTTGALTAGPKGDIRAAAWSPDGSRVVFHKRLTAPVTTWRRTFSRLADFELTLTGILPSFSPTGDRFVPMSGS